VTRPPRLAEVTQLGPWGHGVSDETACQECDWVAGPDRMRVVEYQARRHVVETRHVVDQYRVMTRQVFLADDVP
jgi:hypothetical protein